MTGWIQLAKVVNSKRKLLMSQSYYVVREWIRSEPKAEKELRTHFECGTFATYREANECAKLIEGGMCFPQQVEG